MNVVINAFKHNKIVVIMFVLTERYMLIVVYFGFFILTNLFNGSWIDEAEKASQEFSSTDDLNKYIEVPKKRSINRDHNSNQFNNHTPNHVKIEKVVETDSQARDADNFPASVSFHKYRNLKYMAPVIKNYTGVFSYTGGITIRSYMNTSNVSQHASNNHSKVNVTAEEIQNAPPQKSHDIIFNKIRKIHKYHPSYQIKLDEHKMIHKSQPHEHTKLAEKFEEKPGTKHKLKGANIKQKDHSQHRASTEINGKNIQSSENVINRASSHKSASHDNSRFTFKVDKPQKIDLKPPGTINEIASINMPRLQKNADVRRLKSTSQETKKSSTMRLKPLFQAYKKMKRQSVDSTTPISSPGTLNKTDGKVNDQNENGTLNDSSHKQNTTFFNKLSGCISGIKNSLGNFFSGSESDRNHSEPLLKKLWNNFTEKLKYYLPNSSKDNDVSNTTIIRVHPMNETFSNNSASLDSYNYSTNENSTSKSSLNIYKRSLNDILDSNHAKSSFAESKKLQNNQNGISNRNSQTSNLRENSRLVASKKLAQRKHFNIINQEKIDHGQMKPKRKIIKRARIEPSTFDEFTNSLDEIINNINRKQVNHQDKWSSSLIKSQEGENSVENAKSLRSDSLIKYGDISGWNDSEDSDKITTDSYVKPFTISVDTNAKGDTSINGQSTDQDTLQAISDEDTHKNNLSRDPNTPVSGTLQDKPLDQSSTNFSLLIDSIEDINKNKSEESPSSSQALNLYQNGNNTVRIDSFTIRTDSDTDDSTNNKTSNSYKQILSSPTANLTLEIKPEITISVKNTQVNNPRRSFQSLLDSNIQNSSSDSTYDIYQSYYHSYYGSIENTARNEENSSIQIPDFIPSENIRNDQVKNVELYNSSNEVPVSLQLEKTDLSPYVGPVMPISDVPSTYVTSAPAETTSSQPIITSAFYTTSIQERTEPTSSVTTSQPQSIFIEKLNQLKKKPLDKFMQMIAALKDGNIHDKKRFSAPHAEN